MKTYSFSKNRIRSARLRSREKLLILFGATILLVIGIGLLFSPLVVYGKQQDTIGDGLVYLQSDTPGRSKITHKPNPLGNEGSTIAETSIPAGCTALGMYASPHGPWLAVDVSCEASGFVQIINVASGKVVDLDAPLTRDNTFLNWAPTGNEVILRTGNLPDSQIYLIQVNSGKFRKLPVPGNVYDLALSTNSRRMIYSLTWGLGYGSETWIADVDGGNAQRVLTEPNHIIAFAHWSPSEKEITYIRMPDSNIPFTIGELWVMGENGQNPILLGSADAGHGYRPAWSPDGKKIAFVVREQNDEETETLARNSGADYVADKLVSNIYLADLNDKNIYSVTEFHNTLTETPVWSPDGEYIAFSITLGDNGSNIWIYETRSQQLKQVTQGEEANYPSWLSLP